MKAIDVIDSIKVIWDNETQPRCGWCNAPLTLSKSGFIKESQCDYCGSTLRNPMKTLMNLAIVSSIAPLLFTLMDRFGVFKRKSI